MIIRVGQFSGHYREMSDAVIGVRENQCDLKICSGRSDMSDRR